MITLHSGAFGWDFELVNDQGESLLIQSDYDYPGVATSFGWAGPESDISGALAFLDDNVGASVEDPGYFND